MESKGGKRKITPTHTQKHSCNFISCIKKKERKKAENSGFQLQKTEARTQNKDKTQVQRRRCKMYKSWAGEESVSVLTYVLSDFILLLNVLHGGQGNG